MFWTDVWDPLFISTSHVHGHMATAASGVLMRCVQMNKNIQIKTSGGPAATDPFRQSAG